MDFVNLYVFAQKKEYLTVLLAFPKQITGIEPASSAWEADVLPMNYICKAIDKRYSITVFQKKLA